jgi:putative redox protein
MRDVEVETDAGPLRQRVTIGPHTFLADEPTANGGEDKGPEPHEWLLAALGTCTAMTMQLYARRKGWDLRRVHVRVTGRTETAAFVLKRHLRLEGALTVEQRERIVEIAEKCPVSKTLRGTIRIETTLA